MLSLFADVMSGMDSVMARSGLETDASFAAFSVANVSDVGAAFASAAPAPVAVPAAAPAIGFGFGS